MDWNADAQRVLKEAVDLRLNTNVAKNVIFFLGDGMGMSTVTAGRVYTGQQAGNSGEEYQLVFDTFPHVAFSKVSKVGFPRFVDHLEFIYRPFDRPAIMSTDRPLPKRAIIGPETVADSWNVGYVWKTMS